MIKEDSFRHLYSICIFLKSFIERKFNKGVSDYLLRKIAEIRAELIPRSIPNPSVAAPIVEDRVRGESQEI